MSLYHAYKNNQRIHICAWQIKPAWQSVDSWKLNDEPVNITVLLYKIFLLKTFLLKYRFFLIEVQLIQYFQDGAIGKEPTCQCRRHKRHRFNPWVGKIPWRKSWQPTPVFLPGEFHGQRKLVGYGPQGCTESDTTEAIQHAHTRTQLIYNVSGLHKSDSVMHIYMYIHFHILSLIGYYKIFDIVSCAIQQVLTVYLFYIQCLLISNF